MKEEYTINQIAKMFHITTNKVRFYESKGLLAPIRKLDNQYRTFNEKDIIKLQMILLYRAMGLSIDSIKNIFQSNEKENYLTYFNNQWNFNHWAKTYDADVKKDNGDLKIYKNYELILQKVFELVDVQKKENPKILEIGVGTGNLASKFLNANYDIIGIDQSREMLSVAKEKYPSLKVRLGEFLKIPYESKQFDYIISTYAFHHLNHEEKCVAVEEMLRVLKDNGQIIIGDLMFESKEAEQDISKHLSESQIESIKERYNLVRNEIHKFSYYTAPQFDIIISGVGIINATIATYVLLNDLKCTKVLNYGVAGLTGKLYQHRSIFSVDKIYKRDVNFSALGYEPYHFPDKPSFIQLETDTRLPILDCYTSDEYIGPESIVPDNVLVDMEGYCVANVCERYGVPCMIYKSISDQTSDNDTQGQIDTYLSDAIKAISDYIDDNILQSLS